MIADGSEHYKCYLDQEDYKNVHKRYYKSLNEIRRNRPDLWITLEKQDFICKLKVAKKRFLWIAVGD